jgi:hypothetical protein
MICGSDRGLIGSRQHVESRPRVTAGTVGKVVHPVTAKRPRTVMTRCAIVSRPSMLLGNDVRDLSTLAGSRPNGVALIAADTLSSRVVIMPEDGPEQVTRLWRASVGGQLVTYAARSYLALGGVTAKAVRVGLIPDWDRLACAVRRMACGTALSRTSPPLSMHTMVEFHIKTFSEPDGEAFHARRYRLQIRVTDGANCLIATRELVQMASDT